jgi:lysine-ketoglutarate reductase/saccharopine dehydrogenase-like protein (TIGR00300 family)
VAFTLPQYKCPDFSLSPFVDAPLVHFEPVKEPGVAPENYHATSIYPEYFQREQGLWELVRESRMDSVVVVGSDGSLRVKAFRHLEAGEAVACGRGENGEEGIFVHTKAFHRPGEAEEKFAFRTQISRETAFSVDYDELYELLAFERERGFVLWVLGPAVAFDKDARNAMVELIGEGYVHGLLAGNALAVHDIEGSLFGTALGQELYTRWHAPRGHYKHLDAINRIRALGTMEGAVRSGLIKNGIMKSVIEQQIPYVLAGSIRDDGPLPEVIASAYEAQDRMRELARRATTVIALATQLHSIATGNMIPSYTVEEGTGTVRPVYFFSVDMSEFAAGKLANRGSLSARAILTNAQDFLVTLQRGLRRS